MYAVLKGSCKPSKAVSTDQSRPVITSAELRQTSDGWELIGTDSYQLVRFPLTVVDDPTYMDNEPLIAGPIHLDALKAIDKAGAFRATANTVAPCNHLGVASGQTFHRQSSDAHGQFPKWDSLIPVAPDPENEYIIGLDAKLLAQMAAAMGANGHARKGSANVYLRISLAPVHDYESGTDKRPTYQGKAMSVSVDGSTYAGLLMPVRPPNR